MIDFDNDEVSLECPFCSSGKENKLNVNIDKMVYHCYRCGFHGKVSWLAKKYPNLFSRIEDSISISAFTRLKTYANATTVREMTSPVMSELKSVTPITCSDPHYTYLINRGWTDELISLYTPLKTSTQRFKDRVIIPVTDTSNRVVYFTARDITGSSKQKYINPVRDKDFIFTSSTPVDTAYTTEAFICEGIFDAFKIPGACSLLGKTLNRSQHSALYAFLKPRKTIYICFDPGTETEANALAVELDSWFIDTDIKILNWVSDKPSAIDLGEISKKYSYSQVMRFIKENSHDARLLKIL